MTDDTPRVLDDLIEVVQAYDLTEIKHYGLLAQRRDPSDEDPSSDQVELKTRTHDGPGYLEARFRGSMKTHDADLSVDLAVIFTSESKVTISQTVMPQFLADVALMAAYPYIREALMTSAARLGVERPLVGLLRRGDVELPEPE